MNIDTTLFFDLLLLTMHIGNDKIRALADQLFSLFRDNSNKTGDVKIIKLYIDIAQEILDYKLNATDSKANIVNTIIKHTGSPIFRNNAEVKRALIELLDSPTTPEQLSAIRERLNNVVIWYQANSFTNRIYGDLRECRLTYNADDQSELLINVKSLVSTFKDTLLEIESTVGSGGPVEIIDFSSKSSLGEAVDKYNDSAVYGVIKTGLQGLNQLLGKPGGFIAGSMTVFAALQHNFKTGMLVSLLRWIPKYNPPTNRDPTKNLILFISLEDAGYMNLIAMFEHIYCNVVGGSPDNLSKDEIVDHIYEYFRAFGYTLIIERHLPRNFGYDELVSTYERYSSAGYEIKAVICDYLEKMKKNGSASNIGNHLLIQELYNSVRNFFSAVGVSFFTAAQLNREASITASNTPRHKVRQFSERHLAGSIDIGRETDTLIYIHIECDEQDNPYLTAKWGKCRHVKSTPEVDKFACWKFIDEYRGIPDDVGMKATHVRDIYATTYNKSTTGDIDVQKILGV